MSGRLKLTSEFKKEDFYNFYRKERKGYAKIRLLAMHHLQRGLSTEEVAKIVGYPRQTIWEWIQWYEKGGLPRLQSRPHNRGRQAMLTPDQEASLKDEVVKLQEARLGGRITGKDINQHIENLWGIHFAKGSIYTVLKRLDLVWITGRSRHPKSDPKAQEVFKK
jgi:transposase